jgi:4-hydroxy-4-methyl-2-oxoglutarate aldolase
MVDLQSLGTATLHEAYSRRGALPPRIKPVQPEFRLCGPAVPVLCDAGSNLALHRAIYAARPGDVLVATVIDLPEYGSWGEIMSVAAQQRELGGLVIDACVRDSEELRVVGFPVFASGLCIQGTSKDHVAGGVVTSVRLGDVVVRAGDTVVGDADGVVAIAAGEVDAVTMLARERLHKETGILASLRAGETTLTMFGLDGQLEAL